MAIRDIQLTRKPKENEEAFVPLFLRISIWTSRAVWASPAQFRRTSGRWRLGVSPQLITRQRVMVVIVNVVSISAYILDSLSEIQNRVHVRETTISALTCSTEACLSVLSYSIGVLTGSQRLNQTISTLQEIYKITISIKRRNITLKYNKVKHVFLILFITWQIISYVILMYTFAIYTTKANVLVTSLYTMTAYQSVVIMFLQLEWSTTLVEINSTFKLVNDELECLLKNMSTTPQFRNINTGLHRLSLAYDGICEMLRKMDRNGPFILCYFLLSSLHSLILPYNLIVLLCTGQFGESIWRAAIQLNFILMYVAYLVAMFEPCHRLQAQKERTGHLLGGLACQAGRRLDRALLLSFIQQTHMSFQLGPCGLFTFSRPLLASFFGAIGTYLIVIVQFQNDKEVI